MKRPAFAFLALLAATTGALAELRGHGGPVRALAVAPDAPVAITGSFDTRAIVWSLERGAAEQVLQFHDGAVNAVAALGDGRFATAGEDGRVALWRAGGEAPERILARHDGPVVGLAVSPDGARLASASWDGTVRLLPLGTGAERVLSGHRGNVNAVAFRPDGSLVSAGYDATLRIWPDGEGAPAVVTLPTPLNALAIAPDGEIAVAGADGVVRLLSPAGEIRAEIATQSLPAIALAMDRDGGRIAAATIGGSVHVIDRAARARAFALVGPGLPVWSVAFARDGREILTGGADRLVRRWDARTGEHVGPVVLATPDDPLAPFAGSRGAEVFRACAACHTLTPDGGNRAGPTLHRVMGRRIASVPGYPYSDALRGMDVVWSKETIARLFEVGPAHYTPGTKMPEQRIVDPADREALVTFLEAATR